MKFIISDNIIKNAEKCIYNHACLETGKCGNKLLCEIDYGDGKDILFLKTLMAEPCPYRITFGNRQVCRCPVHFEIYKKYGKNR